MLSQAERHEIDEALSQFPQKSNACIDALKIVNKHRRWVSDEGVEDVAAYLEMPPGQVDQVATFYNLIFRKPVGRHVILLCDSVSCWILGYEQIYEHLQRRLEIKFGQTTEDGDFTLLPIPCLGACDRGPAMMVDEDFHGDLTPEKTDRILDEYRGR